MGQAKRRSEKLAASDCICGSGRQAAACCYNGKRFNKQPAKITLHDADRVGSLDGCYLAQTNSCCDKKSREHLVSFTVLEAIAENKVTVRGFPWQEHGTETFVGKSSLVAKCLCNFHNNALTGLDDAAGRLFRALAISDLHRAGEGQRFLLSGHDIERWMLKTLCAMAYSRNLQSSRKIIAPNFHPGIKLDNLLENPAAWPPGAGLYFIQSPGEEFLRSDQFGLSPLTKSEDSSIVGLIADVQGLKFVLMAAPPDDVNKFAKGRIFRPGEIQFGHKGLLRNRIEISWLGDQPRALVSIEFLMTDGERKALHAPQQR